MPKGSLSVVVSGPARPKQAAPLSLSKWILLVAATFSFGPAPGAQPSAASLLPPAVTQAVKASQSGPQADTKPAASEIAAEIAGARAALARLESLAQSQSPPALVEEQRNLQSRLILLLGAQQRHQAGLPEVPQDKAKVSMPPSLLGSPPYPVADVDTLRDQFDGMLTQRSAIEFALRGLDPQIAASVVSRRKAEEALRLSQDRLVRTKDGDDLERLRAEAEVARLEVRVSSIEVARGDQERKEAQGRMAQLSARIEQFQREIDRVRRQQIVTGEFMAEVAASTANARKILDTRRRKLEALLVSKEQTRDHRSGDSQAASREVEAIRGRLIALAELDRIEAGKVEVWRMRRLALEAEDDPERRTTAATLLRRSIDQLAQRIRTTEENLNYARAAARLQRLRTEALASGADYAADERRALEEMALHIESLEGVGQALEDAHRLLQRSLEDLGNRTPPDRSENGVEHAWSVLRKLVGSIWRYELFSVSETTQAEGRLVTLDYAVTVGKSVGVILLFALGYRVARLLSRGLITMLVRWTRITPALGRVLHRWVMSILLLVVLIIVLKLTRIPLTVFAFMGGALAIGIGFGTQNIIKNLISGVIILFERKIRVGDVITIGGVSGTVSAVDLRATTVRGFDGIESIVPNSNLLENQVSNWSYQSPTIRRGFTIGLGYGQDSGLASLLIEQCAHQHACVLAEPAPEVLIDDFGADALVLKLDYWLTLGGSRSGVGIDSDLRRAVIKAFAEHGLTMAYPQRDVHLDIGTPVEVKLRHDPA